MLQFNTAPQSKRTQHQITDRHYQPISNISNISLAFIIFSYAFFSFQFPETYSKTSHIVHFTPTSSHPLCWRRLIYFLSRMLCTPSYSLRFSLHKTVSSVSCHWHVGRTSFYLSIHTSEWNSFTNGNVKISGFSFNSKALYCSDIIANGLCRKSTILTDSYKRNTLHDSHIYDFRSDWKCVCS